MQRDQRGRWFRQQAERLGGNVGLLFTVNRKLYSQLSLGMGKEEGTKEEEGKEEEDGGRRTVEGGNGRWKCNKMPGTTKGPLQSVIRKSEHKDSVINQMLTFYFKFISF